MTLEIKTISSLHKVYHDQAPNGGEQTGATMLQNEIYSYQIAVCSHAESDDGLNGGRLNAQVFLSSPAADSVTLRRVGHVPSQLPAYKDCDENVERTRAGLFPDPLFELDGSGLYGAEEQWHALWITIDSNRLAPGTYPIEITIENGIGDGKKSRASHFEITVLPAQPEKQKLIYTNWFHADCLYTHYGVAPFSEDHWRIIGNFMKCAASRGMNMILTPLFTPPLDTAVGGERPDIQLIGVEKTENGYLFDFSLLARWINLAKASGISYFEMSHLFTQWGAGHAPKIIVGGEKYFGWQTDAASEEYRDFLRQFLTRLDRFLTENGLCQNVYFHISDEPALEHLEAYSKASGIVREILGDKYPILDALSNYDFYQTGLVTTPIPSTDHFQTFYDNGVKGDLWTYYCCGQYKKVANRFFSMPSARNRILGVQLYKYNIKGFLQWGYNFWYSQFSLSKIDPYITTDSGGAFPSGDPFTVYPGKGGSAIASLRTEIFYEAIQDMNALNALEKKIGREKTLAVLEAGIPPITMEEYPTDPAWIIKKREEINRLLAE